MTMDADTQKWMALMPPEVAYQFSQNQRKKYQDQDSEQTQVEQQAQGQFQEPTRAKDRLEKFKQLENQRRDQLCEEMQQRLLKDQRATQWDQQVKAHHKKYAENKQQEREERMRRVDEIKRDPGVLLQQDPIHQDFHPCSIRSEPLYPGISWHHYRLLRTLSPIQVPGINGKRQKLTPRTHSPCPNVERMFSFMQQDPEAFVVHDHQSWEAMCERQRYLQVIGNHIHVTPLPDARPPPFALQTVEGTLAQVVGEALEPRHTFRAKVLSGVVQLGTEWSLVACAWACQGPQISAGGGHTILDVVTGAALVMVLDSPDMGKTSWYERRYPLQLFGATLESESRWQTIKIESGSHLILRPNTLHVLVTTKPSIIRTTFEFHPHSMLDTLLATLSSFFAHTFSSCHHVPSMHDAVHRIFSAQSTESLTLKTAKTSPTFFSLLLLNAIRDVVDMSLWEAKLWTRQEAVETCYLKGRVWVLVDYLDKAFFWQRVGEEEKVSFHVLFSTIFGAQLGYIRDLRTKMVHRDYERPHEHRMPFEQEGEVDLNTITLFKRLEELSRQNEYSATAYLEHEMSQHISPLLDKYPVGSWNVTERGGVHFEEPSHDAIVEKGCCPSDMHLLIVPTM
ncbi:hypothetical protein BKA70DRAFT_1225406 [Coprinopsis sp. MPI-PUGE-AT-0042]|nr:hypothetical protein BKA70DRAFT_1225406 [Coprinopsis sp. MPI-PUGE-AT-0042]